MNGCKGCIAYRLHQGVVEPEICMECGEKTLMWKQDEGGYFYLECSNCSSLVGVDLNTPCELDHRLFAQKSLLLIEPQEQLPQNTVILQLGKIFSLNGIQMRDKLKAGYSIEVEHLEFEEIVRILDENGITFRYNKLSDPRKKYTYYRKCKYPYSAMRKYIYQ